MRCNRRELADILGITVPTVTAWIDRDGMPYVVQGSKGVEWSFDTAEVIAWFAQHKFKSRDGRAVSNPARDNPFADPADTLESEDEAKARKERALADINELKAAREADLLVPIEDVEAIVVEENARVRTRLLGIPTKLRPTVIVLMGNDREGAEKVVASAEKEILAALAEVKSWAPSADEDDGE